MKTLPLSKVRVLVTRPVHQAQEFIEGIERRGGVAFHLPSIDIVFSTRVPDFAGADLIIFTSVNSVIGAQLAITNFGSKTLLPLVATIGNATKKSLSQFDIRNIFSPAQNGGSESLLELLASHVKPGMKVVIVRGDSGRDTLRDGLMKLGALVHYEQVYERKLPIWAGSDEKVTELWQLANPHIVSVSSDLGLHNLIELLPAHLYKQLFCTPLVVNSKRCLHKALNAGFHAKIFVANPPGDAGQLVQLARYAQSK